MKKLVVLTLMLTSTLFYGQEKEEETVKKNELKISATSLIAIKSIDVTYEYLLNEESSYGISAFLSLDNSIDYYKKFSITPFYRHYFSKKYARGFFIEGFGMLNSYKTERYNFNTGQYISEENKTDFAMGISAGGKFVTKRGFIAEIFLGVGRNLGSKDVFDNQIVGRGGISLGFNF